MAIQKITKDNFNEFIQSDEPVMVDFFATWCESCKFMTPILEKIEASEANNRIGMLDVDDYRELAVEHGVKSIPTLMVFKNGEVQSTSVGRKSRDEVVEMLAK